MRGQPAALRERSSRAKARPQRLNHASPRQVGEGKRRGVCNYDGKCVYFRLNVVYN